MLQFQIGAFAVSLTALAAGAYAIWNQQQQNQVLQAQLDTLDAMVVVHQANLNTNAAKLKEISEKNSADVSDVAPKPSSQKTDAAKLRDSNSGLSLSNLIDTHLMANPIIIEQALMALDKKRQEEAISVILNNPSTPIIGNPDGDISIVEFFDYNCGYCRQMAVDLRELIAEDPMLRVVLIETPILNAQSQEAARISLAAFREDPTKYEKFHFDLILGDGRVDGNLAKEIARQNSYNVENIETLAMDAETTATIQTNYMAMDILEISGTPALYLSGELMRGRVPKETLQEAIQDAREKMLQQ